MRFKMFAVIAAFAVLAVAGVAIAATSSKIEVAVTGKAGQPAGVKLKIGNTNVNPALAPDRIRQVLIRSKSVKWNAKGAGLCSAPIPTDLSAIPCASTSKVGHGSIVVVMGKANQPNGQVINGKLTIYNYKAGPGVSLLLEVAVNVGGVGANLPVLARVAPNGSITADIPNVSQLPPIAQSVFAGADVLIQSVDLRIKPTKKGGKPFITLKPGPLTFSAELVRE